MKATWGWQTDRASKQRSRPSVAQDLGSADKLCI